MEQHFERLEIKNTRIVQPGRTGSASVCEAQAGFQHFAEGRIWVVHILTTTNQPVIAQTDSSFSSQVDILKKQNRGQARIKLVPEDAESAEEVLLKELCVLCDSAFQTSTRNLKFSHRAAEITEHRTRSRKR